MLIKRGYDLNALRTVVYLVKHQPETVHTMPPAMPPIKDEGSNEVSDTSAHGWRNKPLQMEQGSGRKPSFPAQSSQQHNSKLNKIHRDDAKRPLLHLTQRPTRSNPLQHKALQSHPQHIRKHHAGKNIALPAQDKSSYLFRILLTLNSPTSHLAAQNAFD